MPTAATPDPPAPPDPPRATYGALLRLPGAAAFFAAACTGRLGIAMTGLGLVWLVHGATGSYGTAGVVTGAFAVAEAVVGPQAARLVDRHGQTRVLPVLAGVHAGAVAVLAVCVGRGAPTWSLVAAAVLAGASIPQLGALSAARWVALVARHHAGTPSTTATAFAMESVANAGAYLAGPAAVSAIATSGHPTLGSACAAALVVAGAVLLASRRESAPPVDHRGPAVAGPAARRSWCWWVSRWGWAGASEPRRSRWAPSPSRWGRRERRRCCTRVGSVSGLGAAWAYGSRRWTVPLHRRLAIAAVALLSVGTAGALRGSSSRPR